MGIAEQRNRKALKGFTTKKGDALYAGYTVYPSIVHWIGALEKTFSSEPSLRFQIVHVKVLGAARPRNNVPGVVSLSPYFHTMSG